jgi:aryl-alcohol dehydrogenase-like predicted oxidoreductase
MQTRKLGSFAVSEIGLGCMSLSHGYGERPDRETATAVLNRALDLGCTHIDTASLYGGGHNESLIGEALHSRYGQFVLASKAGLGVTPDGKRVLDGRPETLRQTLESSLRRLRAECIDLYYLHRVDPAVPIEESVGALADFVREGKIRAVGLSEASAATLRRAHAVHPIAAMQTEYSLWTRNVEIAVRETCRELGVALVAFSPLARGFLTGRLRGLDGLPPRDLRRFMPRFDERHYPQNLKLLEPFEAVAREVGCTMGQLALAWLLAQGEHVIPLPGTGKLDHLAENLGAAEVRLDPQTAARVGAIINQTTVSGPRYNPATQADIDTEEFAA